MDGIWHPVVVTQRFGSGMEIDLKKKELKSVKSEEEEGQIKPVKQQRDITPESSISRIVEEERIRKEAEEKEREKRLEEEKKQKKRQAVSAMVKWHHKFLNNAKIESMRQKLYKWTMEVAIKTEEQKKKLQTFKKNNQRVIFKNFFNRLVILRNQMKEKKRQICQKIKDNMLPKQVIKMSKIRKLTETRALGVKVDYDRITMNLPPFAKPNLPHLFSVIDHKLNYQKQYFCYNKQLINVKLLIIPSKDDSITNSYLYDNFRVNHKDIGKNTDLIRRTNSNNLISLSIELFRDYEKIFDDDFIHLCYIIDLSNEDNFDTLLRYFKQLYSLIDKSNKDLFKHHEDSDLGLVFFEMDFFLTLVKIKTNGLFTVKTNTNEAIRGSFQQLVEESYETKLNSSLLNCINEKFRLFTKIIKFVKDLGSVNDLRVMRNKDISIQYIYLIKLFSKKCGIESPILDNHESQFVDRQYLIDEFFFKLPAIREVKINNFVLFLNFIKSLNSYFEVYYRKAEKKLIKVDKSCLKSYFTLEINFSDLFTICRDSNSLIEYYLEKLRRMDNIYQSENKSFSIKLKDMTDQFLRQYLIILNDSCKNDLTLNWDFVCFLNKTNMTKVLSVAFKESDQFYKNYIKIMMTFRRNYVQDIYLFKQNVELAKRAQMEEKKQQERENTEPNVETMINMDILHDLLLI